MNKLDLRNPKIVLCVLAFIGFAVYANSITNPFVFDDTYNIEQNTAVHDLRLFFSYFTDPRTHNLLPENAPYRPLMTLSNAVLWAIGGGATWPYHLYKIASHILVAWMIFLISSILIREAEVAFIGALLFLVHPALSETVNYISSTSTLQSALFYLLGFYLALKRRLFPMALCFFCSVLSKEEGVTFPGAVALYTLVFERDDFFSKENVKLFLVTLAPWCVYLAIYLSLPQSVLFSDVSRDVYLYTQFRAWVHYLVGIVTPWGYAIEHNGFGFSKTPWSLSVIVSFLANAVVLFFATLWALVKRNPKLLFLGFGLLWFYLTLLPASSIFPLSEPINEHRYYLSYTLLFPALVSGLYPLARKFSQIAKPALLTLCFIFATLTFLQNQLWQDEEEIWGNTVKQDPANGRAHLNYGLSLLRNGKFDQAFESLNNCIKYLPAYLYCYVNLGVYYNTVGKPDEALKSYYRAVELAPSSVVALSFLGEQLAFGAKRNTAEAIRILQQCASVSQNKHAKCLYLLAFSLRDQRRYGEAVQAAQKALELNRGSKEVRFELGLDLIYLKRFSEAKKIFEEELRLDARESNAYQNLGWIYMQEKNWAAAKEIWRRKLQIEPNHVGAWTNLRETARQLRDTALVQECDAQLKRLQ